MDKYDDKANKISDHWSCNDLSDMADKELRCAIATALRQAAAEAYRDAAKACRNHQSSYGSEIADIMCDKAAALDKSEGGV